MEKQYNPRKTERKWYESWQRKGLFRAVRDKDKKPFCVVIPPPNITGILHMGHALNNTIQDVLVRYKRMKDYVSLWMPGTDHAGIATQNVVERELLKAGLTKDDIGREEFIKRLWDWKEKYGSTIINQLKTLGASCDWDRHRFTMDQGYSESVKEAFLSLYKKGLIYRGKYIINWCPRCKTALADEEAPYKELQGKLYYIKYPIIEKVKSKKEKGKNKEHIVVATTRPETMLGDTAVAVNHSDVRYRYLKDYKVILPIMERELAVIEDNLVDPDFGTGIVKVTPAHDKNDFDMGKRHDLEFINIMDEESVLNENAGSFKGLDRFTARKKIVGILKEKGLLAKEEDYKVNAGHCYRCNTMTEPRLSKQWFVKMKPLAEPAIKAVEQEKIRFHPSRWKKVYLNWMENIQDWCISRQIWWGHRIPVYYCHNCLSKSQLSMEDKQGPDCQDKGVIVSKDKPSQCPECGSRDIIQEEDVLDTWFSSWLWPFATFYWPFKDKEQKTESREQDIQDSHKQDITECKKDLDYFYPTDVLVTASEILFFWVARMIMSGLEFQEKIPFKDVFIHGTVRDIEGIKMSKSLGNVIDPLGIIDEFGADALRFSLMFLVSSGSDAYLCEDKFILGRNFSNKVWNAARYILSNTSVLEYKGFNTKNDDFTLADKWILTRINDLIDRVTSDLDSLRVSQTAKCLYDFFWHDFCDWYLEISKIEKNQSKNSLLIFTLDCFLRMIHPFMPFISEEIYQKIKGSEQKSIMVSPWPEKPSTDIDLSSAKDFIILQNLVVDIRSFKKDLGINQRIELNIFSPNSCRIELLKGNSDWVNLLARAILNVAEYSPEGKIVTKNPDYDIAIDKRRVQDLDKHKVRVNKKIEDTEKVIRAQEDKLSKKSFLDRAPQEIVDSTRNILIKCQKEKERLERIKWG